MENDERGLVRCFAGRRKLHLLFSDMTSEDRNASEKKSVITGCISLRTGSRRPPAPVSTWFSAAGGGDEFVSTGDRGIELDLLRRLKLRTFFRRNPVSPFRRFL